MVFLIGKDRSGQPRDRQCDTGDEYAGANHLDIRSIDLRLHFSPKGSQIASHFLIQLSQVTLGRNRGKLILQGVNHCLSIFVAEVSAE